MGERGRSIVFHCLWDASDFFNTFEDEIKQLDRWNRHTLADVTLRKLIYVGIIVAMETYLSDAFINTVVPSDVFKKKFVETFHDFRNEQIFLTQIYVEHERIEATIKQTLLKIIWHNLPKVSGIYKDTLNIDFGDISIPQRAVLTRHDLVHRSGRTKDGEEIQIDEFITHAAITDIFKFVESIDVALRERQYGNRQTH